MEIGKGKTVSGAKDDGVKDGGVKPSESSKRKGGTVKGTATSTLDRAHGIGRLHYGYAVFFGTCLLMLPEALPINSASIFFMPVTQEFGIPQSVFGIHTTIISLSIFLSTAFMSRMFNRLNLRVFMCAVMLLDAACFLVYSLAQNVWAFYVSSFFIGAVQSVLVYMVVPVLVNNWFSVRTNLFIGIGTAMQGVGGALFSALGSYVIAGWGWRACYVMFAFVALAIGIPVSAFVLRREPADMGLEPIGGSIVTTGSAGSAKESAKHETETGEREINARDMLRGPAIYILIAASLLLSCGIIFNYYLNPYVQDLGASITQAGLASSLVMVGMCLGKVGVGAICDRSVAAGVAVGCGCGAVACLMLANLGGPTLPAIYAACTLFGICYASSTLLGIALTRHTFGPFGFNSVWPVIGMFIALGNAFGSTFWGVVTDAFGYRTGLILDLLVICCALIISLACARMGRKMGRGTH